MPANRIVLESAGSGAFLAVLDVSSHFADFGDWLALQAFVYCQLQELKNLTRSSLVSSDVAEHVVTADTDALSYFAGLPHERLLRLFDGHDGPELTQADIRRTDFCAYQAWMQADAPHTVVSVSAYEIQSIPRRDFAQQWISLSSSSRHASSDKAFVVAVVSEVPHKLQYAHDALKDDPDVVRAAVQKNGSALSYASDRLQHDKELLLLSFRTCSDMLVCIDSAMMQDFDFARKFLATHPWYFNMVDVPTSTSSTTTIQQYRMLADVVLDQDHIVGSIIDKEMLVSAVARNAEVCRYAGRFAEDEDIQKLLHKHGYLLMFSQTARLDKSCVLDQVSKQPLTLRYAPQFADDLDVVLAAVKQRGMCLEAASLALRNNEAVVLEAVKNSGFALQYASHQLKHTKHVVLEAVKKFGLAIQYVPSSMQDTEVVLAAVRQAGEVLKLLNPAMRSHKDVVLAAVRQAGSSLCAASASMKADEEVVLAAIHQNPKALDEASESMKSNKKVVLAAVSRDGMCIKFACRRLQRDKQVRQAALRQTPEALMTTGADYDDCLFAAKHHCSAIAWMATLDQSVQQQNILLAALSAHPSAIEYIRVQHIRTEEQSRKLAQHFVRSCFNKGMSQDEVIKTAEQSQCPHLFLDVMSVLSSVKPTH